VISIRRSVMRASASALLVLGIGACGGKNAQDKMQAAADSMATQHDSAMAHMDSAGVIHNDSVRVDSTKRDSTRKKTPS